MRLPSALTLPQVGVHVMAPAEALAADPLPDAVAVMQLAVAASAHRAGGIQVCGVWFVMMVMVVCDWVGGLGGRVGVEGVDGWAGKGVGARCLARAEAGHAELNGGLHPFLIACGGHWWQPASGTYRSWLSPLSCFSGAAAAGGRWSASGVYRRHGV